ncbi:hypothetical protein PP744_gp014 [Rhizobium phage RHph_N38]|uniref:Uncharacterized protein n=1 Tax=Rhizobium phage RHph_N38 TaxID=2509750 RepID=A0A7S5R3K6_9CAUD|nr:hypothetical protein PP744_gp014 [Rhizobium phage RHph_N38]QIG70477.1 hypothetical protein EVB89_014 [Rhizobium phage RHph_N38]
MNGHEEFETTAKWMEVRKRIAKKMVNDMEGVMNQVDQGGVFDMVTFRFILEASEYCDRILLGTKEKN